MQYEISTAEAAEIFSVTKKTVCEWANAGIAVKLAHGKYDLKLTLANWVSYQRCVFERVDNPLELWQIRRDVKWSESHPLPPFEKLIDIEKLGRITQEALTALRPRAGR